MCSDQSDSTPQLEFTWDPDKATSNISKHGVSFPQAASVFADAVTLTVFDAEHSEFEERWFTLGTANNGKLWVVSHTHTATSAGNAQVRIISARAATRSERRQYEGEPRLRQRK